MSDQHASSAPSTTTLSSTSASAVPPAPLDSNVVSQTTAATSAASCAPLAASSAAASSAAPPSAAAPAQPHQGGQNGLPRLTLSAEQLANLLLVDSQETFARAKLLLQPAAAHGMQFLGMDAEWQPVSRLLSSVKRLLFVVVCFSMQLPFYFNSTFLLHFNPPFHTIPSTPPFYTPPFYTPPFDEQLHLFIIKNAHLYFSTASLATLPLTPAHRTTVSAIRWKSCSWHTEIKW